MSLTTPTTQELTDNIVAQLQISLNQTIPLAPVSFLRVVSKVLAGVVILLYKYGGFSFLQMFVQSASHKDTTVLGQVVNPLNFWGVLIGVGLPTAATNAEMTIDITVTNQVGSLPTNTQLINSTNGVTYITLGAVLLDAATVSATVRAVEDQANNGGAGALGNLNPGDNMSFANAQPNVSKITVVTAQTVTGANAETTDAYRQRVTGRWQNRLQGGAYADYQAWANEVEGIINAYPYTGDPGEVDVYTEATVASSGSPDGIPTAAQLIAVFDNIELDQSGLATRRNANTFVNSLAITRTGFDVLVTGITGVSDLAQAQSDVTDALAEYFLAIEPFIAGLTVIRNDEVSQIKVASIVYDVVVGVHGGSFTSAVFNATGFPALISSRFMLEGEKSKLTGVTFV